MKYIYKGCIIYHIGPRLNIPIFPRISLDENLSYWIMPIGEIYEFFETMEHGAWNKKNEF